MNYDTITNPWLTLPTSPPYVLPDDKRVLDRYKSNFLGDTAIRLDTMAYPYLGDVSTAKVLLLALNGGFSEEVIDYLRDDPIYLSQRRKSLTFESDSPFFYLDPRFDYTLGYQWWYKRLRVLIEQYGQKTISETIACVQYFPYCSKRYKALPRLVPSQEFSFALVRQAIQQGKEIVVMRSRRIWLEAIPELMAYPFIRSGMSIPRSLLRYLNCLESALAGVWYTVEV